jgi:hypothetical protein
MAGLLPAPEAGSWAGDRRAASTLNEKSGVSYAVNVALSWSTAHRSSNFWRIGDQGTSAWLFPGGQPGRPISAYRMSERLRQLDILPAHARSAALFQLAAELPAAVLARMLGIHISVAVAWQRAAAGDWAAYAAEISRRSRPAATPHGKDHAQTERHSGGSDI